MNPEKVPVSVVIAASNEEREIAECIQSLGWASEIVVVENDSRDATVQRAKDAGAIVFSHPFMTIGAQRNAAIERARMEWILVVDADERGTPELGEEVRAVVTRDAGPEAYRAPRRNFFLGREIRHGGWERDRPVRLFRRSLRYDTRPVHEHVIVMGEPGVLHEPLLHTPYATMDEYFEKLMRYSRWWAQQNLSTRRATVLDILIRPKLRFFSMFILRSGWRDGVRGVLIAVLGAMSVAAKYAQLWALQHQKQDR